MLLLVCFIAAQSGHYTTSDTLFLRRISMEMTRASYCSGYVPSSAEAQLVMSEWTKLATTETTVALIKPHAFAEHDGVLSSVLSLLRRNSLLVRDLRFYQFDRSTAELFYAEHADKPFFPALTDMICQGPVAMLEIEGPRATARWRELIGPTNPSAGAQTTLRAIFGDNVTYNAFHGSSDPATAMTELQKLHSVPYLHEFCLVEYRESSFKLMTA